jgi:hypothetical protein
LPITNGSFLEAQFQSFADPLAVIHHGQHRAQSRLDVSKSSCSGLGVLEVPDLAKKV